MGGGGGGGTHLETKTSVFFVIFSVIIPRLSFDHHSDVTNASHGCFFINIISGKIFSAVMQYFCNMMDLRKCGTKPDKVQLVSSEGS